MNGESAVLTAFSTAASATLPRASSTSSSADTWVGQRSHQRLAGGERPDAEEQVVP